MPSDYDYFSTPMPLVYKAVARIYTHTSAPAKPRILDVGAADGRWGLAARQTWPEATIVGVEIRDVESTAAHRPAYDWWLHCNFLSLKTVPYDCPDEFDIILGNPPFSIADKLVKRCVANLAVGGNLTFLLRLAFLEGQRRYRNFWPRYQPQHVDVLPKSPSFTGGGTDTAAYALIRWAKEFREPKTFDWLDNTK